MLIKSSAISANKAYNEGSTASFSSLTATTGNIARHESRSEHFRTRKRPRLQSLILSAFKIAVKGGGYLDKYPLGAGAVRTYLIEQKLPEKHGLGVF